MNSRIREMSDTLSGWDTPLARLFDWYESLPDVLKANGPREYRGESKYFRFRLTAVVGRLELHVREAASAKPETFVVDARLLSDRSALRPFIEMERRLSSNRGADVDISDILQELPAIRKTFSLKSCDDQVALTGSQRRQMAYLWNRVGLGTDDLLALDSPFEITSDHGNVLVWSGNELPLALASLRPTLSISELGGHVTFYVECIESSRSSIQVLGSDDEDAQPDPSQLTELDSFATRLRTLALGRRLQR
jgi:hypothetical protein